MLSVIGFALCAAAISVLLRQFRPELSMVLSAVCAVGLLGWLLTECEPVLETVRQFLSACTENSLKTGPLLLRALGLCLTTQFACDVCKDAGETAIAARLETAGRAALLLLAMPLFSLAAGAGAVAAGLLRRQMMKRTLVTARLPLLLPLLLLLLLTAGSLGCKAAALPLSAPVAAAMAEEGLTVNPSTIQHFSVRKNGTNTLA